LRYVVIASRSTQGFAVEYPELLAKAQDSVLVP
jgi:hypothetical protein